MTPETADLVRVPRTLDDLGLQETLLVDLVLRRTLIDGRTSISRLSSALCLSHSVAEQFVTELREKKLVEFEGMVGRDYVIVLTEAGKLLAGERMQACAYAGVAPVPLDQYRAVVASQVPQLEVTRESLQQSFDDLVVDPGLIDELGPAMMARGAVFLYGPPGTGKSSIAERMIRAYADHVVVPRAIEVDGQIIMVFDPTVHRPVADQPFDIDRRWVLCERPCVIGGGELVPSMLDLSFDDKSGIYLAPLQLKANNGMFVVDDFGRQSMTPAQLLNRWIVPLDRRIDYLSLNTGVKFDVPFNVKVVFSTNLPPAALGDEAFFRRLQAKVYIGSITDEGFDEILGRVAAAQGITATAADAAHLRHLTRTRGDGDLRPYVPSMVCEIVRMICRYENRPLAMSPEILERVAELYFTNLAGDPAKPMSAVATSHGAVAPTVLGPGDAAAPVDTVPADTAPERTAPTSTAPTSTAPTSTAPTSTAPTSTAPTSTAPTSTAAPERTAPVRPPRPGARTALPAELAGRSATSASDATGDTLAGTGSAVATLPTWEELERTGTAF